MTRTLVALLLASTSITAVAEPSLKDHTFACFDRSDYIHVMALMEKKNYREAKSMFPEKCISAETVNTFHISDVENFDFAATFNVRFPNQKLKMYTYPAFLNE